MISQHPAFKIDFKVEGFVRVSLEINQGTAVTA
jgi:hypothetical protein